MFCEHHYILRAAYALAIAMLIASFPAGHSMAAPFSLPGNITETGNGFVQNVQNQPESAYSRDQLRALQLEEYYRHYPERRPGYRRGRRAHSFSAHARWCAKRYRSYDARTNSYIARDGKRHRCRGPI